MLILCILKKILSRYSSQYYDLFNKYEIIAVDTFDGYLDMFVFHNGISPRHWWLKLDKNNIKIVDPIIFFTRTWTHKETPNFIIYISPELQTKFAAEEQLITKNIEDCYKKVVGYLNCNINKKISYYYCSSFEEMTDLMGISKNTRPTAHFSTVSNLGNIFSVTPVDTLAIISSICKELSPPPRQFFQIGIYVSLLKKNLWKNKSTHLWTAFYHQNDLLCSITDLMQNKGELVVPWNPDLSWLIAGSFCEFLIRQYSEEKFITFAKHCPYNADEDSVCKSIFGCKLSSMEDMWTNYAMKMAGSKLGIMKTWKIIQQNDLRIKCCSDIEDEVEILIPEYLGILKSIRDTLNLIIDYPIDVVLVNYMYSYKKLPPTPRGTATANHILIKFNLFYDNDEANDNTEAFAHEFTHLLLNQVMKIPKWLDEGLAYYVTSCIYKKHSPVRVIDKVELAMRKKESLYRLTQLNESWIKENGISDASLALHESYLFVKYLIENYGWQKLRLLLDFCSKDSVGFNQVFANSYSIPLEKLEGKWIKELHREYRIK